MMMSLKNFSESQWKNSLLKKALKMLLMLIGTSKETLNYHIEFHWINIPEILVNFYVDNRDCGIYNFSYN